jgi:hypothetical protein
MASASRLALLSALSPRAERPLVKQTPRQLAILAACTLSAFVNLFITTTCDNRIPGDQVFCEQWETLVARFASVYCPNRKRPVQHRSLVRIIQSRKRRVRSIP